MNSFIPYLIAAAVLMPLIALMVSWYLWVQRHRQPDAARNKVLRGLLWFLFFVSLAWLTSLILFGVLGGSNTTSAASVLIPVASLLLVAGSIAFQIHQCQRRLRHK